MPHSALRPWKCPYCGTKLASIGNQHSTVLRRELTCPAHRDLPALEQFDDRYLLTEDEA